MWGRPGWEGAMCGPGFSSPGAAPAAPLSPVSLSHGGRGPCSPDKSELFQLQLGMAHALQQPGCFPLLCAHRSWRPPAQQSSGIVEEACLWTGRSGRDRERNLGLPGGGRNVEGAGRRLQVARISLSLPPAIYLSPSPSVCFPLQGRQSVVFFLLVQYAFSGLFEHSFSKPLGLEFLKGVYGRARPKVVKLASDEVSSTPTETPKDKCCPRKS